MYDSPRWRRHPVVFALGTLMTILMVVVGAVLLLMLVFNLVWFAGGKSHANAQTLSAITFIFVSIAWYLNLAEVFRQLRHLDPGTYEMATAEMGFIAFFWSSRAAGVSLHESLGSLELSQYPRGFRRRVRITRLANRLLLATFCLLIALILVVYLFTKWL